MKKGFTLIELLAVIVILALVALIIVPQVLESVEVSRSNVYFLNENTLDEAAERYLMSSDLELPTSEVNSTVISLSELISKNFIKPIHNPKGDLCDGYVIVTKTVAEYLTTPYLKCDVDYETTGYNSSMLMTSKVLNIDYLIVAGGGGGGYRHGGGGGAGGLLYKSAYGIAENTTYTVVVGAGGLGGQSGSLRALNGSNSIFGNITAVGGGSAGQWDVFQRALDGGSGGGSSFNYTALGTTGQGNSGGKMIVAYHHGGGGGAGSAGHDGTSVANGSGGAGLYYGDKFSDSYGQNGWFAGGGGGGSHDTNLALIQGIGGIGGGGNGALTGTFSLPGHNAMPNTGGGGGGAATTSGGSGIGGSGGSGIVLIKYFGSPKATGGIITTTGGYTTHAFTTVGTFSFTTLSF